MNILKTTATVIVLGLLTGVPAAFAHDRDDGDRYRPVQGWERGQYHDRHYRDDDDYWRERRDRHWQHEYRERHGYDRDRDDRGTRVVIGLPVPPVVVVQPPRIKVKVKRLPLPPVPVIVLPRPF